MIHLTQVSTWQDREGNVYDKFIAPKWLQDFMLFGVLKWHMNEQVLHPAPISWTFRILAHELDQYSYIQYKSLGWILSVALKQTKAGPRSSGTPVLVSISFNFESHYYIASDEAPL